MRLPDSADRYCLVLIAQACSSDWAHAAKQAQLHAYDILKSRLVGANSTLAEADATPTMWSQQQISTILAKSAIIFENVHVRIQGLTHFSL